MLFASVTDLECVLLTSLRVQYLWLSPNLGKGTKTGGLSLAAYYVTDLPKTLQRNITTDDFPLVDLVQELLKSPHNQALVDFNEKAKERFLRKCWTQRIEN